MRQPTIVAMDEAQHLPSAHSIDTGSLFRSLHNVVPIRPIPSVFAGLSYTEHVLAKIGQTLGLQFHRIGSFDGEESLEVMINFRSHFGIQIGNCHANLKEFVENSDANQGIYIGHRLRSVTPR